MKKNLVPLLGIAFVVAIISTGLFYGLFVSKLQSSPTASYTEKIVVAARDLKRGTVLELADIQEIPWASGVLPKGSFSSASQLKGLTVVDQISAHEPVTDVRVGSAKEGAGGVGVPSGQRAVSVHIADSSGIVSMLRAGHTVDVQVVYTRRTNDGPETELRTILQDVRVLQVSAQPETSQGRPSLPVVTLLAGPAEADALALADAAARVRLTLRNPLDQEKVPIQAWDLATLVRQMPSPAQKTQPVVVQRKKPISTQAAARPDKGKRILLLVRIVGAAEAALKRLDTRLTVPRTDDLLQVSALQAGLEIESEFEVLSASRLIAGDNRSVSVEATSQKDPVESGYGVKIQFQPTIQKDGRVRIRVGPEITAPRSAGWTVRKIETEIEISDGQSFLVSGLSDRLETPALMNRLFQSRKTDGSSRELLVIVTPRLVEADSVQAAALR